MIAACPKCQTRYRVEPERVGPDGARLRCSQCSAVFRVRVPDASTPSNVASMAPAPIPQEHLSATEAPVSTPPGQKGPSGVPASADAVGVGVRSEPQASEGQARVPAGKPDVRTDAPHFDHARLVLVAHPNPDACKRLADALERDGLQVIVAHDGVEAMLSIQRALPRAVVLDAALPKMFGFQVCEIVKRNESLRVIQVCLMGAIHKEDRYRRAPNEIYGADYYCEPPALPGALLEWLARIGLPLRSRNAQPSPFDVSDAERRLPNEAPAPIAPAQPSALETSVPTRPGHRDPGEAPASAGGSGAGARGEPQASEAHKARVPTGKDSSARTAPTDTLGAERAQAERLARIIVSDIVLYNEEKFTAAVRSGAVLEALRDELQEGRALFRERIDPRVRDERDFLADELVRVARGRGMS